MTWEEINKQLEKMFESSREYTYGNLIIKNPIAIECKECQSRSMDISHFEGDKYRCSKCKYIFGYIKDIQNFENIKLYNSNKGYYYTIL